MRYIEYLGISHSGKTHLSQEFKDLLIYKGKKVYKPKQLILYYYYKKSNHKIIELIKLSILIILQINTLIYLKNKIFKKKRVIIKKKKIILINEQKKEILNNYLNLDNFYIQILNFFFNRFNFDKNNFVLQIEKEIKSLKENIYFKERLYRWFLESFIAVKISKNIKSRNLCVASEGILQRLFIIYNLHNQKKNFFKNIKKYICQYGKIMIVNVKKDRLHSNIKSLKVKNQGYIYSSPREIINTYKNFIKFKSMLPKRLKIYNLYNNF